MFGRKTGRATERVGLFVLWQIFSAYKFCEYLAIAVPLSLLSVLCTAAARGLEFCPDLLQEAARRTAPSAQGPGLWEMCTWPPIYEKSCLSGSPFCNFLQRSCYCSSRWFWKGKVCFWRLWHYPNEIFQKCFTSSVFMSFLRNPAVPVCLSPFPSFLFFIKVWIKDLYICYLRKTGSAQLTDKAKRTMRHHMSHVASPASLKPQTPPLWERAEFSVTWMWLDGTRRRNPWTPHCTWHCLLLPAHLRVVFLSVECVFRGCATHVEWVVVDWKQPLWTCVNNALLLFKGSKGLS